MKCPGCNREWPSGAKFCGACGIKLQTAQGASLVREGAVVDKVKALLPSIGLGKFLEPEPGLFVAQKGSTHIHVRVIEVGSGQTAIRSTSPVTVKTPVSQELLEFLLKENSRFVFGAFGLGSQNEIVFSHTIMASSVDAVELGASVAAVVSTADKYDDQIVQRWGGKTARQMAVESLLAPGLLRAVLKRRAEGSAGVATRPPPSPAARLGATPAPEVAGAVKVGSVREEYEFLSRQRCPCGGSYRKESQELLERGEMHYDRLRVTCSQCGKSKSFVFDVNSFFDRFG